MPDVAGIDYHRLEQRTVLGAKRNLACELAAGLLIAHWDDDDWQAPRRLMRRRLGSAVTRPTSRAGSLLGTLRKPSVALYLADC